MSHNLTILAMCHMFTMPRGYVKRFDDNLRSHVWIYDHKQQALFAIYTYYRVYYINYTKTFGNYEVFTIYMYYCVYYINYTKTFGNYEVFTIYTYYCVYILR